MFCLENKNLVVLNKDKTKGHERNNLKRGLFFFLDQNHALAMVEGKFKTKAFPPFMFWEF